MIDSAAPTVPPTFVGRRRLLRTAAMVTSSGILAGLSVTAAAPALAATALDCDGGNTVDAATGDAADIQTLLTADTAIVCLSGTFPITSTLTFDHDLTLFGLDAARLDGGSASQILVGEGSASLTVQNLALDNGRAVNGGAILVQGDLTIDNSTFTGNQSLEDGGAVYVRDNLDSPSVLITESAFTNNSTGPAVDDLDGYSGGAIFVEEFGGFDSVVEISDSTFSGNEASLFGGAVFAYAAIVEQSSFSDNEALAGGAIYAGLTVAFESTFTDNSAQFGGAVNALVYGAALGSTFVGNDAELAGGAISTGAGGATDLAYGAVVTLNSTFVDNSAGEVGGAIFADYGQVVLSTFLENRAGSTEIDGHSEAIFVTGVEDALEVGGNIFAGSRANAQIAQSDEGSVVDLGGNVFSTAESTEVALDPADESTLFSRSIADIFGADPELRDNGGETETVALIGTSPAINAVPELFFGPASAGLTAALDEFSAVTEFIAAVDSVEVDQRNVERTGLADAGAYEYGEPEVGSELADTGADEAATTWLAGLAALLLGIGAAFAIGTRRISRAAR